MHLFECMSSQYTNLLNQNLKEQSIHAMRDDDDEGFGHEHQNMCKHVVREEEEDPAMSKGYTIMKINGRNKMFRQGCVGLEGAYTSLSNGGRKGCMVLFDLPLIAILLASHELATPTDRSEPRDRAFQFSFFFFFFFLQAASVDADKTHRTVPSALDIQLGHELKRSRLVLGGTPYDYKNPTDTMSSVSLH